VDRMNHYLAFVELLAGWRQECLQFASELAEAALVASVETGIDLRHYETGLTIEMFVDVELATGNAITFWVDIGPRFDSPWAVHSFVRRMAGAEQVGVIEIEDCSAKIVEDVDKAVRRSLKAFRQIDPSVAF